MCKKRKVPLKLIFLGLITLILCLVIYVIINCNSTKSKNVEDSNSQRKVEEKSKKSTKKNQTNKKETSNKEENEATDETSNKENRRETSNNKETLSNNSSSDNNVTSYHDDKNSVTSNEVDSSSQPTQSTPPQQNITSNQTEWEKLGISEYEYYNTPMNIGDEVAFKADISTCESEINRLINTYYRSGLSGGNSYTVNGKYTHSYIGCGINIYINNVKYKYSQVKALGYN